MTDTILADKGAEGADAGDDQEAAGAGSGADAGDGAGKGAEGAGGAQAGADGGSGGDAGADADKGKDWRSQWAGEDKDLLKFLGRFHSADAAVKKFKTINDDIKGGKYLTPLPDKPSDEELAAYRTAHGIPDKPEGYLESLPSGLVVGDDDRPAVDAFLAEMHGSNAPKPAVDAALSAYYKIVEDQQAAEVDRIAAAKEEGVQALRDEWEGDYKRNLNAVDAFLTTLPADVSEALTGGMTADGLPLANNPAVIKWLAGLALEANPLSTVVPGAGANQASAVADEMAAIEKVMRENRAAYNKDEKMQARYRELIEAQQKLKAK